MSVVFIASTILVVRLIVIICERDFFFFPNIKFLPLHQFEVITCADVQVLYINIYKCVCVCVGIHMYVCLFSELISVTLVKV